MTYSSDSLKSKIFALFFATVVLSAHAAEGNFNFYGQRGVHKTQSAQTMGHGRFGLGLFLEAAPHLDNIIDGDFYENGNRGNPPYRIEQYFGGNFYPFLSVGISNYFDLSFSIPAPYLEQLNIKNCDDSGECSQNVSAWGWGDLFLSTKTRIPFEENYPFDLAVLLGLGINTGIKPGENSLYKVNAYGPWVRDPMFIKLENRKDEPRWPYSNQNRFWKFGLAATFDVSRTKAEVPIIIHLNGTYRLTSGNEGSDYPNVTSFSTALEWTPLEFVSGFVEYYRDFPLKGSDENLTDLSNMSLSTVSIGGALHLGKSLDLQFGTQIFTGDKDKYIDDLSINLSNGNRAFYSARLIPNWIIFGGIVGKINTAEPKKEEKKEYRNPDTDGDGVCDPWVAESGKQQEYANVCRGIDLCPYEMGPRENKGCPVQEVKAEAVPAPVILFTATPDVVQKGNSVTLTWQVTNATSVSIDGVGDVPNSGTRKMKPTENTVYTLTATGEGGTQTATADVEIAAGPLPIILFTASSESVQTGQPVTLKWQVTNATEVSISGGIGKVQLKGSKQLKPTENTTYTLTAVGEGGTQTEAVSVEVTPVPVIEARVNLQGVTFGSGNATLTANAKKILDGVAEQLLANPKVKIEIQGHTDNVGNPKSNQDLSERRAKAVVAYLATKGVKMTRMKAVGYGQDVPIADNSTADGRELNRRIEMVRVDD